MGGAGEEYIDAGAGDDIIYAGLENDGFNNPHWIRNGQDDAAAVGGVPARYIYGRRGNDALKGQSGNDRVYGGIATTSSMAATGTTTSMAVMGMTCSTPRAASTKPRR